MFKFYYSYNKRGCWANKLKFYYSYNKRGCWANNRGYYTYCTLLQTNASYQHKYSLFVAFLNIAFLLQLGLEQLTVFPASMRYIMFVCDTLRVFLLANALFMSSIIDANVLLYKASSMFTTILLMSVI
jgi:hypothetical protein